MHRAALPLSALALAGLGVFLWRSGASSGIEAALATALDAAGRRPWLLFFAIAILPSLGVPNCPLMIIGGGAAAAVYGTGTAVAITVAAVITNILWSYWVAAYPLRSLLWQRIERSAKTRWLVGMRPGDVVGATLLLHLTPGVPLFIQTYFPGLHRLNYWIYLLIAVPVQSLYTTIIVMTSGGILKVLHGQLLPVALAVTALILWGSYRKSVARSTTE